jgi:hypothetical protein
MLAAEPADETSYDSGIAAEIEKTLVKMYSRIQFTYFSSMHS